MNKDWEPPRSGLFCAVRIIGASFTVEGERYFTLVDERHDLHGDYTRHLAGGNGLVWNVGETPSCRDTTNLGWTLLMGDTSSPAPACFDDLAHRHVTSRNPFVKHLRQDRQHTFHPKLKHAPILAALVTAFLFRSSSGNYAAWKWVCSSC